MSGMFETGVVVAGAGPAGLAAAVALSGAGLAVVIAETSPEASAAASASRSAALLMKTVRFLDGLGVWAECETVAEPLRVLQFIDATGRIPAAPDAAFAAAEIGEMAFGYNIANADLAAILRRAVDRCGIEVLPTGALDTLSQNEGHALLRFRDGTEVAARLAVAADGRGSMLREAGGIRAVRWDYDQMAVAASFAHTVPHRGVCIEMHRQSGPFTLVPLRGNRSSLVWVERKAEAARILALTGADFAAEVEEISSGALGQIDDVSERAGFPLSSLVARQYGRNRVALAGEAAHVTPPIGAQGLNLGFRDVEALSGIVAAAASRGEDIGSDALLDAYSAARRGDVMSRTLGVDLLNRSLLSAFLPLPLVRSAGLFALASIGPLRRAFMRAGIAPS